MSEEKRSMVQRGRTIYFDLPDDAHRCQAETQPYGDRCQFKSRLVLDDGRKVCKLHAHGKGQALTCNHRCPVHCV